MLPPPLSSAARTPPPTTALGARNASAPLDADALDASAGAITAAARLLECLSVVDGFAPPGLVTQPMRRRARGTRAERERDRSIAGTRLVDVLGRVVEASLDPAGSRAIQTTLGDAEPAHVALALAEILPTLHVVSADIYGNHAVQAFLDHGTVEQRLMIAHALRGHVAALTLDAYGCRVIQKALDVLPMDARCDLADELRGEVSRCVRDPSGNHVIQSVLERVPTSCVPWLLDDVVENARKLCAHPFGCRVVQRVLERCTDARRMTTVLAKIVPIAFPMSTHAFANYVVQHVVKRGPAYARTAIIATLAPHVVQLSMHKVGSHVVEACLDHGDAFERDAIVRVLLNGGAALDAMFAHPYGNFVVQKVLDVCDPSQLTSLMVRIHENRHLIAHAPHGKHVAARVNALLCVGYQLMRDRRVTLAPPHLR